MENKKLSLKIKILIVVLTVIICFVVMLFVGGKKAEAPIKQPFESYKTEYSQYEFSIPVTWELKENEKYKGAVICARKEDNIDTDNVPMILLSESLYEMEAEELAKNCEDILKKDGRVVEKVETGNSIVLKSSWNEKVDGMDVDCTVFNVVYDNVVFMLTAMDTGKEMEPDFNSVVDYIISTVEKIK